MNDEKHYCKNCNRALSEDEAYNTLDKGCKYCGAVKGFVSFGGSFTPSTLPKGYLACYLQMLQRAETTLFRAR